MIELMAERPEDRWEVEALYDLCFAPGREALSSYRLRDDVPPVQGLSQVARDELGILAGAIRFWPVQIEPFSADETDHRVTALLLGPVAVHPTHQGEGLGGSLIRDSLAKAAENGWHRVMLVGDAPYYKRFGFERLSGVEMPPPTNPDRVLGLMQDAAAWKGVTGRVTRWQGEALSSRTP
ncbi:GNAT family N-acetyltransferase [Pseudophaeobacter leonis]|uniref:GNAT family N-acetyltransferase n=1 Tax=Pseudophaeobacter leonis TaxID=1144477 RepID=UPI0009F6A22C|nr:N-acetyltransferase [Pseudophaeobacter leonis]